MGWCGIEERKEVGEGGVGGGGRGRELGEKEVVESDGVVAGALRLPAEGALPGLAVVRDRADVVDGDAAGREEAGEMEELVEVALGR